MPEASTSATSVTARGGGGLTVLANARERQGVRGSRLGLTAVNFWEPGSAGPLTANAPASVLIRERPDGTALVCVSHPPRGATALDLLWRRPVQAVLTKLSTVSAYSTGTTLRVRFRDLTETTGAQRIKVRLG